MNLQWLLHSIQASDTVSEASLSALLSKRNTLFEQLEYFLDSPPQTEGMVSHGNQLASWVSTFSNISASTPVKLEMM